MKNKQVKNIVCNNENYWSEWRDTLGINACGAIVTFSLRWRLQNLLFVEPEIAVQFVVFKS